MIGVTDAEWQEAYRIWLTFNDGASGEIDFYDKLVGDRRAVVRELLDLEKFAAVQVNRDTLCWDNGVDFAPEMLYEMLHRQSANFTAAPRFAFA